MKDWKIRLAAFWQPSPTKNVLVAACLLAWLLLGLSFIFYGYLPTWRLWGVVTEQPFFMDFRLLPAMVQSLHMGLDPTVTNPSDPLGRFFNYPAVWYLLAYTGLSQADTLWMGISQLWMFFVGLLVFPGHLNKSGVVLLLLVGFSPAAMLLYERANVDLFIFFLCAMVIALIALSTTAALGILALASVLKFFPFFGMVVFTSGDRRKSIALLVGSAVLFAAYLGIAYRDVQSGWSLTMRGEDNSYGVQVLEMHSGRLFRSILLALEIRPKTMPYFATLTSYAAAALLILLAVWLGIRLRQPWASLSSRNLTAFRMGAAIYVGTFLLGNNWDYRLVFLAFAVPQLSDWLKDQAGARRVFAGITTVLLVLACWYLFYKKLLPFAAHNVSFLVDEAVKWSLFACLTYLLAGSAPDWVRSLVGTRATLAPVPA